MTATKSTKSHNVRPEATLAAYGDLRVERDAYAPLETVTVTIHGRAKGDESCLILIEDAARRPYFQAEVPLHDNQGSVSFPALGQLGTHWVYLRFPDDDSETPATACIPPGEKRSKDETPLCPLYYALNFARPDSNKGDGKVDGLPHSETGPDWHVRYANFVLDAGTVIRTGDESIDSLYDITRRRMILNRRVFNLEDGKLAYYCSSDTWCTSVAWLRDWLYHVPAARYWECEAAGSLDRFFKRQFASGMIPDNVSFDDQTTNQPVESDAEYVAVMGVWDTWRVNGDNDWMAEKLIILERGLDYVRHDPLRWDEQHQLITRAHTCDTWDFEIGGEVDFVGDRRVIATCDQTGYYLAYRMMAEMYAALNDEENSKKYSTQAEELKRRTNELLWDGVKYQHHVHITPLEHPGFDESQQLASSNTWSMTRGLAELDQAVSIIDEYKRRHEETGDALPWWSLQPGYPDELNYWPGSPCCVQGGYANGGLLPYVGGELCKGSFLNGRERYGVELLKQYTDLLKESGNRVFVWYWPNGEPGMRTANEVPRNGWGMSEWLMSLTQGLAGITDLAPRMRNVQIAPRWAVSDCDEAYVSLRYAVNDSYVAYHLKIDRPAGKIAIECTGSGDQVGFHVLLPDGWKTSRVLANDSPISFEQKPVAQSQYVDFTGTIDCGIEILIECER